MKIPAALLALALPATACAWELTETKSLGEPAPGMEAWRAHFASPRMTVVLSGVSFSDRRFRVRVADNPPPAQLKLAEAAKRAGALAGCNASYFHENWTPLGLVVSDGRKLHDFERARLLSGIFSVRGRRLELVRSAAFDRSAGVDQAVQAGPWLVEDGKIVPGLESERLAKRTALATDGKDRWALLAFSSVSLADTARLLTLAPLPAGWKVRDALNLDGGGSTALWVRGGLVDLPEKAFVRNFLLVEQQ